MLKIGFSSCFFHADPQRAIFKGKTLQYFEQSIVHWVMRQGVMAYLIPNPEDGSKISLRDYVSDLDGLVLQGGSDVSPKSYGETELKPEWKGDYIRDQYEISLLNEFRAQKKPILGICRGLQLMNVAFGGTLYQDIAMQIPGALNHRDWNIYDQNFHQVRFEESSRLKTLYSKCAETKVNTVHHQAIKDLGKDLVIEARSPKDNVVEAIKSTVDSYVYAVQWHPEFHDPKDATLLDSTPLVQDFLSEVQKRKGT